MSRAITLQCPFCRGDGFIGTLGDEESCEACEGSGEEIEPEGPPAEFLNLMGVPK